MSHPPSVSYDDMNAEDLCDDEFVTYLLNDVLQDENPNVVLITLRSIVKARGMSMTDLAEQSDVGRRSVYEALSPDGNPEWRTITRIIRALGFCFSVCPAKKAARSKTIRRTLLSRRTKRPPKGATA